MKISLQWLGDFLSWKEEDPQVIADLITESTAEVEEILQPGALLEGCCVGKVLSLTRHPKADRLQLATVQTDKGEVTVVCGGTNLREGMRVAFAHAGTEVRSTDGSLFTLEKVNIRGEESNGMICASSELDLEELFPPNPQQGDRPVLDLGDGDNDVGTPLRDVLGLRDTVLHIDNHAITQRPDLFSHVGMARECVALGLASWKKDRPTFEASDSFTSDPVPFALHIEAPELMPRYCACIIEIDALGETPDWMIQRLASVSWRPLNLPIDITNYVATEVGVPLHSFDADDIVGDVHMRRAKEGETIVTLDKKERALSPGALVLSDDKGVFDLLGIMGGLRSSTKEGTKRIYLHSASLDPVSIRQAVQQMGHRTDAATVYEKGVPHITTEQGFHRAVQLFLELVPGARVASMLESHGDNGAGDPVTLSVDRASSMLGVDIPGERMQQILEDLECTVEKDGETLTVTPALHRLKDLTGEQDLIEEIGRVYGYNAMEAALPEASVAPPERDMRMHRVRDALAAAGYFELVPLSLTSPDLLKRCGLDPAMAMEIENPIGEETSLLHVSTLPGLLEHAERNLLQVSDALKTLHLSHVFAKGHDERTELGLLVANRVEPTVSSEPFLVLKRDLAEALSAAGYSATFASSDDPPVFAHPGRSSTILVEDTEVGALFELLPTLCTAFDLPHRAAAVLLDLEALLALKPSETIAMPLAVFPAIRYDVTIVASPKRPAEQILHEVRGSGGKLLESVEVVDVYSDSKSPLGEYRLTLRCTYRAPDKTLTEEEVASAHAAVAAMAE